MLYYVWKRFTREIVLLLAFPLPAEKRRALERRLRGREEFRKLRSADAVIVSFGKSGRTWVRVLISRFFQLRYGLPSSALIGFDNFHRKHSAIPRLFFTHDNYLRDYTGHLDTKEDFYEKAVVLLVRHPADVAVSQYFQWKFRMKPSKKSLNTYPEHGREVGTFDFVMDHDAGLDKIIDFMNAWGRERARLKRLLVVRYEDLRTGTAGELDRVLRFIGQDPTAGELADCVGYASIENMRKLEEKRVFWLAGSRMRAKDTGNPNSYKVRRAKVGGYKDYFSDEEVVAIERRVEERLSPGFGYLASERAPEPTGTAVPSAASSAPDGSPRPVAGPVGA